MSRAHLPFRRLALALAALVALALPSLAPAHVERSSYWPDPAPDRSIRPAAGGEVPKVRSLFTSARQSKKLQRRYSPRVNTHVVCKPDSLKRAYRSVNRGRKSGFKVRPTEPTKKLSKRTAGRMKRVNKQLFKKCKHRHIQAAVTKAGNNDRVVVMPGVYREEPSRAKPTNDPKCADLREVSDKGAGAASYRYQAACPNDQSLIYVQGRTVPKEIPPSPPRKSRFGIPDNGACLRCNLQIQGSGVVAEDVLIDAAKDPNTKLRELGTPVKDVGIRADRADGFVFRNMTVAHALEHGIYVHETDGYLLDNFKTFYNGEYGSLTFTSDHGLTSDCEGVGHGDSAVYPGSGVDTGEQRIEPSPRPNQAITRCDIHHNTLGYSGTMGNGIHVYGNNFYDNSTGIATDSFFAGGHPGYPQDTATFERNNIWGNNFNSYDKGSDVVPKVPVVVGTGIFIAGGNNNSVRNNRIWDNWRRGVMLIAVPDVVSGETGAGTTSNRNRFHDNIVGIAPDGKRMPNGVDFWWDQHPGNADNCWFNNGEATFDPPRPLTPSDCNNISSGATYASKAPELARCAAAQEGRSEGEGYNQALCEWFQTPPRPGSSSAARAASQREAAQRFTDVFRGACDLLGDSTLSCAPYRQRP